MSEERLKDLLERAIPEAPEIRADGVAERAAVVRRRQLAAGGAALVLVAGAVVGGFGLLGSGQDDAGVAGDPVAPTSTTSPYEPPICPTRLPGPGEPQLPVPGLDDVVAVRLCPDLLGFGSAGPGQEADQVARLADLDALVDVGHFRDSLADLAPFDSGRCAAIDFIDDLGSLMFVLGDGSTTLVRTAFCASVDTPSGAVDGGDLETAFLTALDRQRSDLAYTRALTGDFTCDTRGFRTPARPGRERLVAGLACDPANELVDTLENDRLAKLQAAWDDPQPEVLQRCLNLDDAPAYLKVVTDHGDVVDLLRSQCGDLLVWRGWQPGQNAAIPITLEELGLR